ncbi:MAG: hypothetical protein ACRDB3_17870 [Citrobacter telavivensis]
MANTYSQKGLTGKSTRKKVAHVVTHLLAPVLHNDRIEDAKDPINDSTKSGKQAGSLVIHESASSADNFKIAVAIGGKPTDPWFKLSAANITIVTPTA